MPKCDFNKVALQLLLKKSLMKNLIFCTMWLESGLSALSSISIYPRNEK